MSGMEFNKIFAAILVAGTVASFSGFVANEVFIVEPPAEDSYIVEVTEEVPEGGAAVVAKPEPVLALLAAADVARGEALSKACAACHSFDKGGPNRVGPNLWNIVNNKHAHMDGFAYSDAMKALHDKPWTYSELNGFLWNPKKHLPGTKMVYAGLKKPEDRAALIAWLRTLSDTPAPLPTQAEIDAEIAALAPPAAEPAAAEATEEAAKEAAETPASDAAPTPEAPAPEVKEADAEAPAKDGAAAPQTPTAPDAAATAAPTAQ